MAELDDLTKFQIESLTNIMHEEKLFNEWRERLGLQDWAIQLKYNCKSSELENTDAIGEVQYMTTNKCAVIRIISKEEYDKGEFMLSYDFEKTLIHELLHIKFGLIDKNISSYESVVVEDVRHQLIDDLARAFVLAKQNRTNREGTKIVNSND